MMGKFIGSSRKRMLRQIFEPCVSEEVLRRILREHRKIRLAGEKRNATVLVADLSGFSRVAEQQNPRQVVQLLKEYLTEMSRVLLDHEGTVVPLQGDGMMALFGAPLPTEDHPLQACQAALKMQRRMEQVHRVWKAQDFPTPELHIGICSGEMILGNMGSERQFRYSAIGQPVELASRLEKANKLYSTGILLSDETLRRVEGEVVVRPLDRLRIKGFSQPIGVYELIALQGEPLEVEIREALNFFQQGYQYYLSCQWDWAMNQFRQVLQIKRDDSPSRLYLLRCQALLNRPPRGDWDGVFPLNGR